MDLTHSKEGILSDEGGKYSLKLKGEEEVDEQE